jgi:hypothetical protein
VTETGERVFPSDLLEYRRTHEFRGPCCLCASLDSSDASVYTEASIFVAIVGPYTGRYVAACATDQCRYWGEPFLLPSATRPCNLAELVQTVCIEELYDELGLLVKRFSKRGAILPC